MTSRDVPATSSRSLLWNCSGRERPASVSVSSLRGRVHEIARVEAGFSRECLEELALPRRWVRRHNDLELYEEIAAAAAPLCDALRTKSEPFSALNARGHG